MEEEFLRNEFLSYERLDESPLSDQIQREKADRERERYLQIVSGCSKVQDALSCLERFEDGRSSDPQTKDDIRTLKLLINVLVPFVGCISKWQTGHHFLEFCPSPVASVLENVIEEYEVFGIESIYLSEAEDQETYLTGVRFVLSNLVKLRLMQHQMGKLAFVVSMSSKPPSAGEGKEAVRFINSLLETLNHILCFKTDLIILLQELIEALQNKLLFLRNFLGFLSEICTSHQFLIELFTFGEAVAVDAACVLYFILVDKMMGEAMLHENKVRLLNVVKKIKPCQPDVKRIYFNALEASRSVTMLPFVRDEYALGFFDSLAGSLIELLDKKPNLEVAWKEQNEILLEGLSSVRRYIEETPLDSSMEGLKNFMTELLDLIFDLGCLICSSEGLESDEKLGDLLDKIQFVKRASGDLLIPRSWQSNFPSTNALGFIEFIMMNMREQLHFSMASNDQLAYLIYKELLALRDDFGEIAEHGTENEELRAFFANYKDVAYQAEYFVDLSLSGPKSQRYQMLGLTDLRESIRQIHVEVQSITKKMTSDNLVHNIANGPGAVPSEANPANIDAAIGSKNEVGSKTYKATYQLVGLDDETKKIKGQLTRGSKQLIILSIVGMAGIGKTTLANSVYQDASVTSHFHACAWCSVSPVYEIQSLLVQILHQVQRETKQVCKENDKDYDQQLFQCLKGKRYLVVLDDIWDIEVWDELRESFPDDSNGSRLMFTTRNHEVASQANSVPHYLTLLSVEESWKLLQIQVFKGEACPPELSGIGKRIAQSCKGLPLAVVLIAGLLKVTEGNQECWERVRKQLKPYVVNYRPGQQWGILELSYMHLPDYLKPCFLYFGAFPEDTEIAAHKLMRLWIAEGFVQQPEVERNSLEYEAENYLNDLIDRSLVIIAKRSSTGGVKACRVHDLLHEFCLARAKEERFLLQINRFDKLPTFRVSEVHEQYRLCIHSNGIPSVRMGNFESRVRTLLFSESCSAYNNSYSILTEFREMSAQKFWLSGQRCHQLLNGIGVIAKFRLLRVLDLGSVNIAFEEGSVTIAHLVYLRYLSIQAYIRKIPEEIANLKNLETFLLSTGTLETVVLPKTILSMVSLRHFHISNDRTAFRFQFDSPKCFEKFSQLESLTSLSTPILYCDKDIEKMMRKFPNLQKLNCIFSYSGDYSKCCNQFPVLDFLSRLQSLKVCFSGVGLYPCNLSFPSSLKKLTLSDSRLPWDEISIIGKLPSLEVLKLLNGAFEGHHWDMKEGEFQVLKFLKLDLLDIVTWNASTEHLPYLEQLVLERCSYLEEIPSAFGEIPTLRRIEMNKCCRSAVDSVKQIEEEQLDMGNHQFKAFIFW